VRPETFTVTMSAPRVESFDLDAPDNEWVWLPRLGPTPFVLLHLLQRDLGRLPVGTTATYTTTELAQRVGTAPPRLWNSIERLVRFDFLERQPPGQFMNAFHVARGMRKPSSADMRRLPESVVRAYRAEVAAR
jgi:hypothetical protein